MALDELSAALRGLLDTGEDPYRIPHAEASDEATAPLDIADSDESDPCPITPRTILEAMLFVGNPRNEPLTSRKVASLMRGVRPAEIDALVCELNCDYERRNCPYTIAAEDAGYRMTLRDSYAGVREQFHGKARAARLSQAAVEVLAIAAYNAPVTAEDVARLRGKPSGPILLQLVRRQLLRVERESSKPRRVRYFTTSRFLELFGLESLDDLPRSQDLEQN